MADKLIQLPSSSSLLPFHFETGIFPFAMRKGLAPRPKNSLGRAALFGKTIP
ncbi:hypothetical protein GBL_1940 [Geobacillus kaustophilus GBlys]|uniref:Uncharacterized protein n=1 Tax=Geobacillus kaustophilus GBlys TaxID=1337888 RepID=U2YA67_GEOKU|nr:hypothetical protein GBL_1940 [Geobacillus kaustophilus GBlys]GAJ60211.1 hypothetical protein B23_3449 [Geobacillus thermoleovorans B23]